MSMHTIIVPLSQHDAVQTVADAYGPEGMAMFPVRLRRDSDGALFAASPAGGHFDNEKVPLAWRDPEALFHVLQDRSVEPLAFDAAFIANAFDGAQIYDHAAGEVVTDAFFGTLGMTIVEVVQPPA